MNIQDIIGSQALEAVDAMKYPSRQHYAIYDETMKQEALVDDAGGTSFYGEDEWQMIVEGYHPDVQCVKLDISIH